MNANATYYVSFDHLYDAIQTIKNAHSLYESDVLPEKEKVQACELPENFDSAGLNLALSALDALQDSSGSLINLYERCGNLVAQDYIEDQRMNISLGNIDLTSMQSKKALSFLDNLDNSGNYSFTDIYSNLQDIYNAEYNPFFSELERSGNELLQDVKEVGYDFKSMLESVGTGTFFENAENCFKSLTDITDNIISTSAIISSSIFKGVFNIAEDVVDSAILLSGTVSSGIVDVVGNFSGTAQFNTSPVDKEKINQISEKIKETTMDFVAKDLVDDAYNEFFEETKIGRTIADASYISYDGKVAGVIEEITKTTATIAVGTFSAPLGAVLAGTSAMAKNAEEDFKDVENRNFYETAGSSVAQGAVASTMYIVGSKVGKSVINSTKFNEMSSKILNEQFKHYVEVEVADAVSDTTKAAANNLASIDFFNSQNVKSDLIGAATGTATQAFISLVNLDNIAEKIGLDKVLEKGNIPYKVGKSFIISQEKKYLQSQEKKYLQSQGI